jgi:hypothetical protein
MALTAAGIRLRPAIGQLRTLAPLAAASALAVLLRFLLVFWMAKRFGGVANAMCHFDCDWYRHIAMGGYAAPGN